MGARRPLQRPRPAEPRAAPPPPRAGGSGAARGLPGPRRARRPRPAPRPRAGGNGKLLRRARGGRRPAGRQGGRAGGTLRRTRACPGLPAGCGRRAQVTCRQRGPPGRAFRAAAAGQAAGPPVPPSRRDRACACFLGETLMTLTDFRKVVTHLSSRCFKKAKLGSSDASLGEALAFFPLTLPDNLHAFCHLAVCRKPPAPKSEPKQGA